MHESDCENFGMCSGLGMELQWLTWGGGGGGGVNDSYNYEMDWRQI